MIRYVQLAALFAAIIFTQTVCSGVPKFTDVRDKNWKLMEVRSGKDIIFERGKLPQESPKDVFTLHFDAERVNGTGYPNKYFAPYTVEKQAIDIEQIAGTLMAPLIEPEQLKEQEFYTYLVNADQWNLVKGKLELRSTNGEGKTVFLVFALAD